MDCRGYSKGKNNTHWSYSSSCPHNQHLQRHILILNMYKKLANTHSISFSFSHELACCAKRIEYERRVVIELRGGCATHILALWVLE